MITNESPKHESVEHTSMLTAIEPLRAAGFALHWLHPRAKRPIGNNWSEAPVASLDQLRATYRPGNNLGVRLGEPSVVADGYLHVLDMDIRVPDLRDEAWEALEELFPSVDPDTLPCVQSGSGGESRHLYLITDKPFRSKKLWTSEGKHRGADGKWHYDAEIELFGTGKQVAMPPSIHPDSGKPYIWLRDFDFAVLDLGIGPFVPSAAIERLAVAEHSTFEFETREPLTFTPDQLARVLRDIPDERIDDYHEWVMLGQALHHQFGASDAGFELWMTHSSRSSKFDPKDRRNLLRKWHGFGKNRRKPVTMATIVEWAKDARVAALKASFDDNEDEDGGEIASTPALEAKKSETVKPLENIPGQGCLEPPVDDIDAIGSYQAFPKASASSAAMSDWISLLDFNEEGGIRPTLHNVELIVKNDPRLAGLPQLNEFTQEPVQRRPPGTKADQRRNPAKQSRQLSGAVWQVRDTINGDLWSDDRDFAIRSILEAPKTQGGYGLKITDRDLKAAIVLSANDNRFHPVREYLEGLKWDGLRRVERLFLDYLGAEDCAYSRDAARLMMIGAVVRIFEPGHKADHVVILEGLQGRRKSTFIKILGRHWFAELDGRWEDSKQLVELMQGAWILELPELSGFNKSDVRTIKAFVSRQKDKVRLAYARRAAEFPRQCIFLGSTNDSLYLRDDTGGRRWWPVRCDIEQIDTVKLEREIDQLWAESVALYFQMRVHQPYGTLPLYLSDAAAQAEASRLQDTRRPESPEEILAGQIGAWLDRPIMSGNIDDDSAGEIRNETCYPEIWVECLGKDLASLNQSNSQMIGRAIRNIENWEFAGRYATHGRYGKQRIFERGGRVGRLARAA